MRATPSFDSDLLRILFAGIVIATLPAQPAAAQEHRVFELRVSGRLVDLPDRTIRVDEGDSVELRIISDEDGELHLHGYDVIVALRANQTSVATLQADVAGRFPVTSHGFGSSADPADADHHKVLLYLEVYPR